MLFPPEKNPGLLSSSFWFCFLKNYPRCVFWDTLLTQHHVTSLWNWCVSGLRHFSARVQARGSANKAAALNVLQPFLFFFLYSPVINGLQNLKCYIFEIHLELVYFNTGYVLLLVPVVIGLSCSKKRSETLLSWGGELLIPDTQTSGGGFYNSPL